MPCAILCCRKADEGLQKVSQSEGTSGVTLANNKHLMAYGKMCSLHLYVTFKMQHLIVIKSVLFTNGMLYKKGEHIKLTGTTCSLGWVKKPKLLTNP